jgi:hypothetical protein
MSSFHSPCAILPVSLLLRQSPILGRFRHHDVPVTAFDGLGFHLDLWDLSANERNQIRDVLIG